jgi:hypothetical protein
MPYCTNCGLKTNEDGVCNCSKPLQQTNSQIDGDQNSLFANKQSHQRPKETQPAFQPSYTQVYRNVYNTHNPFIAAFNTFINMIKKPVDTIRSFEGKDDFLPGIILIGVQSLLAAFVAFVTVVNYLGTQFTYDYSDVARIFRAFSGSFVLTAAQSFLLALLIFLCAKIFFDRDLKYPTVIGIVGALSIYFSIAYIADSFFYLVFPAFSSIFDKTATVIIFCVLFAGLKDILKVGQNRLIYVLSACFAINLAFIWFVNTLVSRLI